MVFGYQYFVSRLGVRPNQYLKVVSIALSKKPGRGRDTMGNASGSADRGSATVVGTMGKRALGELSQPTTGDV